MTSDRSSAATNTVLVVVGTRPEAIKLAPVVLALDAHPDLVPCVVTTGQHPEMAGEALADFGLSADRTLDVPPRRSWSQGTLMAALLPGLEATVGAEKPVAVIVQGDTASALAGAMAGFWARLPVLHVEAGLRTATLAEPFPEEGYRRLISRIATAHLAPTPQARDNLLAEGIDAATICCTGNTVVDAARACAAAGPTPPALATVDLDGPGRVGLLTVHRRESWGEPLRRILDGARAVLAAEPDLRLVVPVHPNPLVRDVVTEALGDEERVELVEPLRYRELIALLRRTDVVLTDSGGIQEEAPTFGVPVVVLRATTERPEAVDAGQAWLVGTDPAAILRRTQQVLAGPAPVRGTGASPFGDGCAAGRVVAAVEAVLAGDPLPESWAPDGAGSLDIGLEDCGQADVDAPDADYPSWARRMERVGSSWGDEEPAQAGRLVLTPPQPTVERHIDAELGAVLEVRRGGQLVRHLPGLAPRLPDEAVDAADPWRWPVRQADGVVWVETGPSPVELAIPGGVVVVRGGAVSSRWDPLHRSTEVTVLSGRADVQARDGAEVALGPRQAVVVTADGAASEAAPVGPADLDDDLWVRVNRELSHARPVDGRLATDPLLVLADV